MERKPRRQPEMKDDRATTAGKIPDGEIQRRMELARRSEFSRFCRPVTDNDITYWMNKNLEPDILNDTTQCTTIHLLLKSLGPVFSFFITL